MFIIVKVVNKNCLKKYKLNKSKNKCTVIATKNIDETQLYLRFRRWKKLLALSSSPD